MQKNERREFLSKERIRIKVLLLLPLPLPPQVRFPRLSLLMHDFLSCCRCSYCSLEVAMYHLIKKSPLSPPPYTHTHTHTQDYMHNTADIEFRDIAV